MILALFHNQRGLSGLLLSALISAHCVFIPAHRGSQSTDGSCPTISALHVTTFEMLDGVGITAPVAAPAGPRGMKGSGRGAGSISCGATGQEQRSSLHNSSQRNSNWALEKRANSKRTAICKHDLRRIWQIWQKRKRKQDN